MKKGEETARAKKRDGRRDEASTRTRRGLPDLGSRIPDITCVRNARQIRSGEIISCQLFNIILCFGVEEVGFGIEFVALLNLIHRPSFAIV